MKKKLSLLAILLQVVYLLPTILPFLVSFIFLLFHWQLLSSPPSTFITNMGVNFFHAILLIANFYIFYLVLFPNFIKTQRLKPFVLFSLLVTLISIGLTALLLKIMPFSYDCKTISFGILLANLSIGMLLNPLAPCGIAGIKSWLTERFQREKLEKTNLETNLALLKAQINPHFLFNTLNNIDVLIEKDAATASVYLKKLSDILRFTLYESPSDVVSLSEEINYIEQYIELQKIRTSNPDFVKFEVNGSTDRLLIAPMLFIPFIENAFKHTTNKKINHAIEVAITITGNTASFYCSNIFDTDAVLLKSGGGLGLELITSRLNLLYPDKYKMDINKTDDRYMVTLTVNLDGN